MVLSKISKLQTQDHLSVSPPFHSRVVHEQKDIEGKINALFILGIVNIMMVSGCLAASAKKENREAVQLTTEASHRNGGR